jgi:putative ABC transport system permease protein
MPRPISKMFFRLLLRAATVRRGRTLTALLAMMVAATLATALLSIYADVTGKLSGDFRKFGANVIISAPDGLTEAQVLQITRSARTISRTRAAVIVLPSAFAVARTASAKQVVVVGTDFAVAQEIDSYWSVSKWPTSTGEALVGSRAANVFSTEGRATLEYNGKQLEVTRVGTLQTGGDQDSRIYIPLADFQRWTGVQPTVLELAVPGSAAEIGFVLQRLQTELPKGITAQPVRQIVEAQARVMEKTRFILLLSTIAITLTVALCVLATLTASVLERRKDYAVMKALGSSQGAVNAIFIGETLSLAVLGSIAGFAAGCGLAMWIGRANFHAAITPSVSVFPPVLAGCVVVALFSAIVPLTLLQKTEPAAMLKGE